MHGVYYPHTEVRPAGYMSWGGQDNPVINIAPQWGKKKKKIPLVISYLRMEVWRKRAANSI